MNDEVDKAQTLHRQGNTAEAFKVLKTLFDSGPLIQVVGKIHPEECPAAAVTTMSTNFEANRTHKEQLQAPAVNPEEIYRAARVLAHNLSVVSTFKIISSYCKIDPTTSEQRLEKIFQHIEEIEYDGSPAQLNNKREREKIFMKELNQVMSEHARMNCGFLTWVIFKLLRHFTSAFSKSLVYNTHSAMLAPSTQPLKGHYGILRGINNTVLALLHTERVWKQDGTGEHGINDKEYKMMHILEGLNKSSQDTLIQQVITKAIDELPIGPFSRYKILNVIATSITTFFARGIVNHMQIAVIVLNTMSEAIYSDKHINPYIDALLLKKIQELEKVLSEGAGAMVIKEGDNGKRLVKQLVDNLFAFLREKEDMTPGGSDRQQALFTEHLVTAIKQQTDNTIKGVFRDLIIFGYEHLQEKEQINRTLYSVLQQANNAVRPSRTGLLRALYSDTLELLNASEATLLARFLADYHPNNPTKCITERECQVALQTKYRKVEEELHGALEHIVNKAIKEVVITQIQQYLTTPRNAVLDYIIWWNEQFDPYHAHTEKKQAYTEEMRSLIHSALSCQNTSSTSIDSKIQEQIDDRHNKLLIQLTNQLERLKSQETENSSKENLQIKRL